MKNTISFVILFLCICSCIGKNEKQEDSIKTETNLQIKSIVGDILPPRLKKFEPPFDLEELKRRFDNEATSTFLDNNRIKLYDRPREKGYYGRYYLPSYYDKKGETYVAGALTIFNDTIPWMSDNKTDIFIELTVGYPGITIFDEIDIGSDISLVDKLLGDPFINNDTLFVYKNETTHMLALFRTKEAKIKWYKYGYYNKEVIDHIENYLPSLLD